MLLEVKSLRGGYGGADVCKGINCSVKAGEILSVLGPNGCGKTTFFRLLLGFLTPSGGTIAIQDTFIHQMGKRQLAKLIAYIPQHHTPIFSYTALEIILMGRASHFSAFEQPGTIDRDRAFAAMEMLQILPLANRKYTSLSGGQRQMVLIARAICQDARLFIMDEPGASLDYANQQLVMNTIQKLACEGYGIVLSTHSPEHPFSIADNVLLMQDGQAAAYGPPKTALTPSVLEKVYGIKMDIITATDRYGNPHTLCIPL